MPFVDLLGDPISDRVEKRKRNNRRKLIERSRGELLARQADPMATIGRLLLDAIDRGDKEDMFRFANALLPYFAPRLTAVAVAPAGVGPSLVGWEDEPGSIALDHQVAVLPEVVPTADP